MLKNYIKFYYCKNMFDLKLFYFITPDIEEIVNKVTREKAPCTPESV